VGILLGLNVVLWTLLSDRMRWWIGIPATLLLILLVNFYRDPERQPPRRSGVFAVSPADGRIVRVHKSAQMLRISIFLSVLDVHVNRAPVAGRVAALRRSPGRFLPAFLGRASSSNERVTLVIDAHDGGAVSCTQVAGLLARRIDNWIETGQKLRMGERYGMIRLGSRVDLDLPVDFAPLVRPGEHVKAGETPLAERSHG
jgi:phosphatidylserine decarboxylase